MFIFRLIGFIVLFCECFISVSGELKCEKNQYKDGATNICMPCSACCPPRPQNQFCAKGCDLNNTCNVPGNPNPNPNPNPNLQIWQIILIVFLMLLVVIAAVVVVICRKNICRRLRRICSRMKGVQDTNPNDPRQLQVISCNEPDSAPTMNGQAMPLTNNNLYVDETSHGNPSRNRFHSIPSGHLQTQNHVSTPYTSLPIPPFLERNGIRFIREDIVMANAPFVEAQLQANLNHEDSDEAIGLLPSMPLWDHSRTTPQSNGRTAGTTPEENQRSMVNSVQCAEDLEEYRPADIHPCDTPVKT